MSIVHLVNTIKQCFNDNNRTAGLCRQIFSWFNCHLVWPVSKHFYADLPTPFSSSAGLDWAGLGINTVCPGCVDPQPQEPAVGRDGRREGGREGRFSETAVFLSLSKQLTTPNSPGSATSTTQTGVQLCSRVRVRLCVCVCVRVLLERKKRRGGRWLLAC